MSHADPVPPQPAHAPGPTWAALAQAVAALPPGPPGPYPDARLRARVAAALLARIKQAVIQPEPLWPGQIGSLLAATEYDLADVALAELAPELARVPLICSDERHMAKVAALEDRIARALAVAEVIDANGIGWAADSIRRALTAPDADQPPPTGRVDAAVAALAEILAGVRTYRDADTGQPIHAPGHITPEQYQRWQQLAHPTKEPS